MTRPAARGIAALLTFAGVTACSDPTETVGVPTPSVTLDVVSGDLQSAKAYTLLAQPVTVRLLGAKARPLKGQVVNFRATTGSGSAWAGAAITDASGLAKEWWVLGSDNVSQVLEARTVDPVTGERVVLATVHANATPWRDPAVIQCQFEDQTNWEPQAATDCGTVIARSVSGGTIKVRFRVLEGTTPVSGVPLDITVLGTARSDPAHAFTDANGVAELTITEIGGGRAHGILARFVGLEVQLEALVR